MGDFDADVIVVGGGSAGAAAARRLVDQDVRVLLLEAGGRDTNPAIHDPTRAHELWFADEDWAYQTVPQKDAADRRLHWPRGKVLGGSSSLNGMIWVRGTRADWDGWAELGCEGWSWDDVLPIFRRIEDFDRGASELHGVGGPVHVISDYEPAPIQRAIVAAAQEVEIPFNRDHNGPEIEGVSYTQLSIRDGIRQGTATAYLKRVADAENLMVVTGAHARRLLVEGGRCVGVEWATDDGRIETANASNEVIVSCGTIESPPLLMRSGIGPADHLREIGIDVAVDLPGVGGNLHDHLLSPVIFSAEREIGPPTPGLFAAQSHLWARSRPGLPGPDIQPLHFMVPLYEEWMEGPENGFSLMAGMIRPESRGSIRLSGPELDDELAIDPRVLSAPEDMASLEAAVAPCRRIGAAPALQEWGARELYPGPEVDSPEDLRDWIRHSVITYHHQVGTCKMGIGDDAVVDPRLRVRGVEGLRVADASIMPVVPSGNTNAPSVLIGERVAEFVVEDTGRAAPAASAGAS
jgi:choline dehydrogenase